ncbi:hypothetical protein GOBAR_AA25764 [Gossypium barbadense]|uniref:Beta-glucosidase n=1 Tax=Gossypium barbadense TaxID=3634 RepID=A0A2P5WUY7_GOSBA|nr:hypothetical protein GOBAR_AA25764 [Gossypium barbadense]
MNFHHCRSDFPPGFVFGASTSAYQYEGAADKDGRTPGIWDTFVHAEGNFNEGNGDVACDGYHKYKEDVRLMVDTGLEAYRFSISWSRLIPNGRGPVNVKGLQYYNNLINELIKNGIQPHATLHHYDLPQTLEDEYGGWLNREIVKDFTAYADICFREFGDRVLYWTTVNEANVFVLGGYDLGFVPPQRCSAPSPFNCSKGNSSTEPYLAAHNILLAHAAVANLYKKKYQEKQHGLVGFNLFNYWFVPLTNTTEDIIAVQRANDFYFGWDYPRSMKENAGSRLPAFTSSESKQVKGSFDFIGLNFYNAMSVKDQPSSLEMEHRDPAADMAIELIPFPHNASKFEFSVTPWALKGLLEYVKEAYGNTPIYIHENGQRTRQNSTLEDWPRVKSLNAYIGSVLDAISYGLYYVDLEDPSLRRVPKLSAKWNSEFLKGKYVDFSEVIQLQDASFSDAQLTD